MSKYIRTKDRLYEPGGESFDKSHFLVKVKGGWDYLSKKEPILKKADTIEELCDAFVIVTNDGKKYTYHSYDGCVLAMMKCEEESVEIKSYGAIWTKGSKGEPILVSVAKTNGKGEFELL